MSLDRETVLRASRDWEWLPPGAERFEIAGVPVIDYPGRERMTFQASPGEVGDAPGALKSVLAEARRRGRDLVDWWVSPSTSAELEDAIVATGTEVSVRLGILALDLTRGVPPASAQSGVEAFVVDDAQRLEDAERVAAVLWGGQPSSGERRADQLKSLSRPVGERTEFRVVAYLDGQPISHAGCELAGEVARLYGGGTLPEARRKGGYQATVLKRLAVAAEHRARLAIVQARVDTSQPILYGLGFSWFGEIRVYKQAIEATRP